jgi:hypothetical protein
MIDNSIIKMVEDYKNNSIIKLIESDNISIINKIPNIVEITDYTNNYSKKNKKNSSTRIKSKDVFKIFKPLDTILINPTLDLLEPILKFFNKSKTISSIVLMSYSFTLYFLYKSKKNLVWLFLFLGIFAGFFDDIYYTINLKQIQQLKNLSNNNNLKKNSKIQYKTRKFLNYEHNEMQNILIKTIIFIILFCLIQIDILKSKDQNSYNYMIVFMLIIIIILEFHTKNKIIESEIANTKESYKILGNILIIRKLSLIMLLIISAYIISNYMNNTNKDNKLSSFIDIFLTDNK